MSCKQDVDLDILQAGSSLTTLTYYSKICPCNVMISLHFTNEIKFGLHCLVSFALEEKV